MTMLFAVTSTEFNVPTGAICVLQYTTHTLRNAEVARWGVYADAISTQSQPIIVDLVRHVTAGSFSGVAPVAQQLVSPVGTSTPGAFAWMSSAIPQSQAVALDGAEMHPQGLYEYTFPMCDGPDIAGGERVGIHVLASATVGIRAKLVIRAR